MVDAVTALWHGSNYQARLFWDNALNLLDDHSCVVEVIFEANAPQSFDDVVVRYNPSVPRSGPDRIDTECQQIKWHTDTGGWFGYKDFTDPKFIGAQSFSLLQRLKNARQQVANPRTTQFTFITTHRIRDDDELAELILDIDGTLNFKKLFDGTTDRSRMGKVRRLWREHLELISDDELKSTLGGFRIIEDRRTLDQLKGHIISKANSAGIVGVGADTSDFRYDELAQQLKIRKLNILTRKILIQFLKDEGLSVKDTATTKPTLPVAIRTFLGPAAYVSDAMPENTLLLTEQFKQRYLRDDREWQRDIRPQVQDFLCGIVHKSSRLRLILDTHASIAFLSGTVLDVKSSVEVQLVQKGRVGARTWQSDDGTEDNSAQFSVTQHKIGSGRDIVVAISVAQPVEFHVRQYTAEYLPDRGKLLLFALPDGTGHQKVVGGGHAVMLAEQVANTIRQAKQNDPDVMVHVFAAVPNSLMFYLGQNHQGIAPCIIYEFDFDRQGSKTYQPSFVID